MNNQKDGTVEMATDGCSNPRVMFSTGMGYVNYQSLQEGRLGFKWPKNEWLVNHPRGKVRVEYRSGAPDNFSSDAAEFTNGDRGLSENVFIELSKNETTPLIGKFVTYRARVDGEGDYKAYAEESSLFLIDDQLPTVKCDNIVPDKAELYLDATPSPDLVFSQEVPEGRSGTVAPVVFVDGGILIASPVAFSEKYRKNREPLEIAMSKRILYYGVGTEVFVGCRWSFGQGDKYKEYYSEMRKLTVTANPVSV